MNLKQPVVGIAALSVVLVSAQAIAPGLSSLTEMYRVSESTAALLLTLPPLFMIPFTLLGTNVLRYVSKKTLGLLSILLIAIAGATPYVLSSFPIILATRGIMGIGFGFLNCIAPSLAADYYPPGSSRDRATGIHGAFAGGGGLIYSFLGGWLCSLDVKAIYLVHLVCLIPMTITLITLPGTPTYTDPDTAAPSKPGHPAHTKATIDPHVIKYTLMIFLYLMCAITLVMNISQVIVAEGVGTTVEAGLITSLFSVGGLLVGFTFARFLRFFQRYVFAASAVFSALGMLIIALTRSIPLYGLAAVSAGIGLNLFITSLVSDISDKIRPESRVLSFGIVMSANNLGQFVSPIIMGILTLPFGQSGRARIILSAGLLIGFAVYLFWDSIRSKKAALP